MYDAVTNVTLSNAYFTYDSQSRVSAMQFSFDYTCSGTTVSDQTKYSYAYSESTGNLSSLTVTFGGSATTNATISPQYDNLGRMTEKAVNFKVNGSNVFYNLFEYDYKSGPGESILVSQLVSKVGQSSAGTLATTTYNYTYDANGNITQIKDANGVVQNMYTYDDLGQLTREDNRALNKSYEWTYDDAGNILSRSEYAFTTGTLGTATSTVNYTYGNSNWGDQLTKYGNSTITYDEIGNPIYMGGDTYEWEGRKLISRYDDYEYFTYTYNADGIRTSKEYGEFDYHQYRHEYTLNGTQIVKETVYYNEYGDSGFVEDYTLVYIYDETGSPIGMKYREPSYAGGVYDVFFFEKNLQGDIVSVYNSTGEKVLSYTYDAWGNFTQTYVGGTQAQIFTAQKNPFRYRGYYYDTDTDFYYLQSRYYNPEWGRFVQSAHISNLNPYSINGLNSYNYAYNNSVNIAYSSCSLNVSFNGGMGSSLALGGVAGGGDYLVGSNSLSITPPSQNWVSLGIDFTASMSGALSVLGWTMKNPEFYEFWYTAYGTSKYDMLSNLKSPMTKFASVISYSLVAYDTYTDVMGHINAGDSWQTTTASGIVTTGVGAFNVWASSKVGAAVGTAIGGVPGFIIGTASGAVVGIVINGVFYTEINGKSIAGYVEDGIEWLLEWIS